MHGARPAVMCPAKVIGTPGQTIKIKRGGKSSSSNSGPCGWKKKPSAVLHRSLAEMAAAYRQRKRA